MKMIASVNGELAWAFTGRVFGKVEGFDDVVKLLKLVDVVEIGEACEVVVDVVEIGEACEVVVDDMEDGSEALTFVTSVV